VLATQLNWPKNTFKNLLKVDMLKLFKKFFFLVIIIGLSVESYFSAQKIIDFFSYVKNILAYPYVWALTENENMLFIHGILSQQPVYKMHNVQTFFYFVYPPFFHLLSAALMSVFGFTILLPRFISLFSFLAFGTVLWLFFKEKGRILENTLVTWILIAGSVSITLYSRYFILGRADMLAFAFAFISLFCVWKILYQDCQNYPCYFLAGAAALCALFTKQSVFFPYIVIALSLLFAKDRKRWLVFGISLGVLTGLMFLTLNIFTQNEFAKSMLLAQSIYGRYLNSAAHLHLLQNIFITHYKILLTGIIFIVFGSFYSMFIQKKLPLFSVLLAVAVYINFFITGGNEGAEHNTLIPLLFGVLVMMKELYFFGGTTKIGKVAPLVFLGIFGFQIVGYQKFDFPYVLPTTVDKQNHAQLVELLKSSSTSWVLGDRIDYDIFLAGKNSPLEASTHNVALSCQATQTIAFGAEKNLIDRIKKKNIGMAVVTITKFGNDELLSQISSSTSGTLVKTVKIDYMDAPELNHKVYRLL